MQRKVKHLYTVKQKPRESDQSFIRRFNNEILLTKNIKAFTALVTFKHSLYYSDLFTTVVTRMYRTYILADVICLKYAE